jgi:nucleoside 2-deoxyribosyltransferase
MAYRLIQAGNNLNLAKDRKVFLGGSSRGNDWREELFNEFKEEDQLTFISPFRTTYPNPEADPKGHSDIVEWERNAIAVCDIAIFWLGAGLSNQAARVEIGYALGAGKTVLVGAEDSFLGLEHLSSFGGIVLSDSLKSLTTRLTAELNSIYR